MHIQGKAQARAIPILILQFRIHCSLRVSKKQSGPRNHLRMVLVLQRLILFQLHSVIAKEDLLRVALGTDTPALVPVPMGPMGLMWAVRFLFYLFI